MKVLHISSLSKGGAAIAAINLHKAMLANGIESKMLLMEPLEDLQGAHFFDQYIQTLPFRKKLSVYIKRTIIRLFRALLRKNFEMNFGKLQYLTNSPDFTIHPLYQWADIVHLHWVQGFVHWGRLFGEDKKNIVWTLHDMAPFAGGYYYDIDKRPRQSFERWSKILESRKKSFLRDTGTRVLVVSPSVWMGSRSASSKAFGALRHEVIPNCIDTTVFRHKGQHEAGTLLNREVSHPVLLFVASSVSDPRKGIQLLLNTLGLLSADLLCIIVGDSAGFTAEQVKQRVLLTGPETEPARLAAYYGLADIYICPSVEDNLPNTVLESLCCGTPVAGFNIGGMPDVVRNGENGQLSDELSAHGLAGAIHEILRTTFDRQKIASDAARQFSYQVIGDRYMAAYIDLLKSGNS